ncbi:MAG: glutathione S-transferase family protein [Candidatus Sericytochromatia bacterium]
MYKLSGSLASPYVRKVRVLIEEKGLQSQVKLMTLALSPIAPDKALSAKNPLGKIPLLECPDGTLLYDSRVICEYLDGLSESPRLIPASGPERWSVLRLQALADGILDAGVLIRYETFLRPEAFRWAEWLIGQGQKVQAALDQLEQEVNSFSTTPDLGNIAVACAFGWLHFRKPLAALPGLQQPLAEAWPQLQAWYEIFSQRPSLQATLPIA